MAAPPNAAQRMHFAALHLAIGVQTLLCLNHSAEVSQLSIGSIVDRGPEGSPLTIKQA